MPSTIQRDMLAKVANETGFIAALDQSGGSTPKALALYGVSQDEYSSDEQMFGKVHEMRTRIMTNSAFNGDRVLGAILFENTLDREVDARATAHYLWQEKHIVPFLKVDKGLENEANGVQLMKPITNLDELLAKANAQDVFGTKMRSVIKLANEAGIEAVVAQQFAVGQQILDAGLVPIIEPEIDISSPQKAQAEALLQAALLRHLDQVPDGQQVMLKLTLPEESGFYAPCIAHPKALKVVALSGGYSRDEANARLAANPNMIASFSRALTQGVSAQQSDAEFTATIDAAIAGIYAASST
ncbi:MAG: fructose bisphosphate aldolase [Glaciecola sp.]|nr:fructose bisphosphate aldolase [Glaciecola sp.]MDG1815804.1 fructose bisphosphate aldolase [Glaciecola sp.]MDG2100108.1 fructose bisphosphate aldolase [Glaciecola sp.]